MVAMEAGIASFTIFRTRPCPEFPVRPGHGASVSLTSSRGRDAMLAEVEGDGGLLVVFPIPSRRHVKKQFSPQENEKSAQACIVLRRLDPHPGPAWAPRVRPRYRMPYSESVIIACNCPGSGSSGLNITHVVVPPFRLHLGWASSAVSDCSQCWRCPDSRRWHGARPVHGRRPITSAATVLAWTGRRLESISGGARPATRTQTLGMTAATATSTAGMEVKKQKNQTPELYRGSMRSVELVDTIGCCAVAARGSIVAYKSQGHAPGQRLTLSPPSPLSLTAHLTSVLSILSTRCGYNPRNRPVYWTRDAGQPGVLQAVPLALHAVRPI